MLQHNRASQTPIESVMLKHNLRLLSGRQSADVSAGTSSPPRGGQTGIKGSRATALDQVRAFWPLIPNPGPTPLRLTRRAGPPMA